MAWNEWTRKFFSEPGTVITMFTSGALGFLVSIANGVIQKRHGGWSAFWGAVTTGTVIAILVGLSVSEYVKSEAMRYAIIGFCAIISDDIWAGFKTLGAMFRSNPLDAIFRVLSALRGQATPPAATVSKED